MSASIDKSKLNQLVLRFVTTNIKPVIENIDVPVDIYNCNILAAV